MNNLKSTSKTKLLATCWLLLFNLCLNTGFTHAQNTVQHVWSNQVYIPGPSSGVLGSGVIPLDSKTDAQGNTYIFGSFKGTVDLDPGVGVVSATSTNTGGVPATAYQASYLVKLNKYGEYVWSHAFASGGGGQNWAKGISITAQGKIFVTGFFNGNIIIAGTSLDGLIGGRASYCAYMAQINEDGTLYNANKLQGAVVYSGVTGTFLTTNIDIHTAKVDEDGNILVAGAVSGDLGGNGIDLELKTATVASYIKGDYFIAKYDTSFNLLSHKKLTFSSGKILRVDQIEAKNDTIFVQGYSDEATVNMNGTTTPAVTPTHNGNYFTAAYTSTNLNCIWAFKLNVDKQRIRINPTGGLAFAWQAYGPTYDIDPTSNTVLINGGQYTNIFMAHFNTSTGALINSGSKTARRLTDTLINNSLFLGDIDFASNGSFFINGIMGSGTIDMDPSAGVRNIIGSNNDFFVAKYNANFTIDFAQAIIHTASSVEVMHTLEAIDNNTFTITATSTGNGLNMDPVKYAPSISSGTFNAGVYAKYTSGASSIIISVNAADTVESCKLFTTANATSNNNNYTYQWYKNGVALTTATNATINTTDVGTYQCLVRNSGLQQWTKKILFNLLSNYATFFSYQLNGNANNVSPTNNGVSTAITYGTDRNGTPNSAAIFNGTSSEIIVNGALISSTYTGASLWFKRANSTRKAMSLLGFQVAAPGTWNPILYLDSTGRLSGYVWPGNGNAIYSSGVVVDTNWHHAAWTYDAALGKQIIYLDGVEVGSRTSGTLQPGAASIFKIGNGYLNTTLANVAATGNNQFFEGMIDDVKITSALRLGNAIQLFNEIKINKVTPEPTLNNIAYVCAGTPVTTTIHAANPNLSYQWYYNGNLVLANDTNFIGFGTNSFTVKSMPAGSVYGPFALVTDNFCNAVNNVGASLSGATTSSIISQPSNKTACIGGNTFLVTRATVAKNYTWKKNGVTIPNSNNDTLYINNVTSNDFGNYTCTITSCSDSLVTTNSANLSQFQLNITSQPVSQNSCLGNTVQLYIGTNNNSVATYQWIKDGVNIAGETKDTLTINSVLSNSFGAYTVIVGGCANNLLSDTAFLTQGTSGAISSNQLKLHLKLNGNATDATGLNVSNQVGAITYGLDKNNTANSAADFNSSTYVSVNHSANLVFTNAISMAFWVNPKSHNGCRFIDKSAGTINNFLVDQAGTTIRAYVAGKYVFIEGLPPLNTWTHIAVTYLASGSLNVYFNGVLKGSTAGANAQLTSNTNALFVGAVQGATCKVNALMDDVRIYSRELTQTEIIGLVNAPEVSFTTPAQSTCEGGSFTTQVNTTSNAIYQWYKNGIIIPGATSQTYTKTNALLSDSGTYTCDIYSAGCVKQTATVGKVTINPKATITAQPSHASSCANGNIQLNVAAAGVNNTYSWLKNGIALTNGGNIAGANTSSLAISFLSGNDVAAYRCVVTNSCGRDTSNIANVTLSAGLQITQQPTNLSACENNNAQLIIRTNDQNASYTWRKNGVVISNSNNDTLTINNATAINAGNYQAFVTSACGNDSSTIVSLTVNTNTQITTQPISKISCGGAGFTLTTAATGTNLTYQWRLNEINISNQTSTTFSKATTAATDTGNYTLVVSGTCGVLTSNIAKVSLANPIAIVNQPDTVLKACSGDVNITTRVNATGSINSYQWFLNNVAINDNTQITGATTNQLRFEGNAIAAGNLTCKMYGTCDTVATKTVVFSYYQAPVFSTQPISQSICVGANASFTVKATNATGYKWYLNGTLISDIPNKIIGTGTDSVYVMNVTQSDIGGTSADIVVHAIGSCLGKEVSSNTATITLNTGINIKQQSNSSITICETSPLLLYVNTNSNATYIWKKNGSVIGNQTNDTLLINAATSTDAGNYICEVTSACGNITSNTMVVSINSAPTPTITQAGNTLSTQIFDTYQWYKNNVSIPGANTQNYLATETGTYHVTVSNNNACNGTSALYNFTFVGIDEILNLSKLFSAYPNPANQLITIKMATNIADEWSIKIYDIAGAEVASTNMYTETNLPVATWAQGLYLIKATNTKGQVAMLRFVKE